MIKAKESDNDVGNLNKNVTKDRLLNRVNQINTENFAVSNMKDGERDDDENSLASSGHSSDSLLSEKRTSPGPTETLIELSSPEPPNSTSPEPGFIKSNNNRLRSNRSPTGVRSVRSPDSNFRLNQPKNYKPDLKQKIVKLISFEEVNDMFQKIQISESSSTLQSFSDIQNINRSDSQSSNNSRSSPIPQLQTLSDLRSDQRKNSTSKNNYEGDLTNTSHLENQIANEQHEVQHVEDLTKDFIQDLEIQENIEFEDNHIDQNKNQNQNLQKPLKLETLLEPDNFDSHLPDVTPFRFSSSSAQARLDQIQEVVNRIEFMNSYATDRIGITELGSNSANNNIGKSDEVIERENSGFKTTACNIKNIEVGEGMEELD